MEKIKDVTKVVIPDGSVFVEICHPKRVILTPDGTSDQDSYLKVLVVGKQIDDIEVGDICVKCGMGIYVYVANEGKSNEKRYAVVYRSSMNIVVKADNFINPDVIASKIIV